MNRTFGEEIKYIRLQITKMGLRFFAERLGVKPSYLHDLEAGYISPPQDNQWFNKLTKCLCIQNTPLEEKLIAVWRKPFIMKKKHYSFPIFAIDSKTGECVNDPKRIFALYEYLKEEAEKHNKKADEFNEGTNV